MLALASKGGTANLGAFGQSGAHAAEPAVAALARSMSTTSPLKPY